MVLDRDGGSALSDGEIEIAVERELIYDPQVPRFDLEIDVGRGVVEIRGEVPTLLARERAVRLAESVKGVRSVSSRITIAPADHSDHAIRRDVVRAIALDPAASRYKLGVEVEAGTVTLRGSVESGGEKRLLRALVESVRGVRDVQDQLNLLPLTPHADADLRQDIEKRLAWDTLVNSAGIEVKVDDGVAELRGVVHSAADLRRAEAVAWVKGVRGVDSKGLRVSPSALHWGGREAALVTGDPEEVRSAIERALNDDPRLAASDVHPRVDGSVVTLEGRVRSLRARRTAEHLALHTHGVASVRNRIEVVEPRSAADSELRRAIASALALNAITETLDIRVRVSDRLAVLSGTVDTSAEKAQGADVAEGIEGVRGVINRLTAKEPHIFSSSPHLHPYQPYVGSEALYAWRRPTKHDRQIAQDIENELNWSPFVDSRQVHVAVVTGRAVLSGTVNTWEERRRAAKNAYEGGAVEVDNKLEVPR